MLGKKEAFGLVGAFGSHDGIESEDVSLYSDDLTSGRRTGRSDMLLETGRTLHIENTLPGVPENDTTFKSLHHYKGHNLDVDDFIAVEAMDDFSLNSSELGDKRNDTSTNDINRIYQLKNSRKILQNFHDIYNNLNVKEEVRVLKLRENLDMSKFELKHTEDYGINVKQLRNWSNLR
jgi:hypothetical protein